MCTSRNRKRPESRSTAGDPPPVRARRRRTLSHPESSPPASVSVHHGRPPAGMAICPEIGDPPPRTATSPARPYRIQWAVPVTRHQCAQENAKSDLARLEIAPHPPYARPRRVAEETMPHAMPAKGGPSCCPAAHPKLPSNLRPRRVTQNCRAISGRAGSPENCRAISGRAGSPENCRAIPGRAGSPQNCRAISGRAGSPENCRAIAAPALPPRPAGSVVSNPRPRSFGRRT
jgi:hypothetical protein